MNWYIFGMVIGSIALLAGFSLLIYRAYKQRSIKKLIKRLGTSAEVAVNADIKIWAKHTKNKFIQPTIFKYGENKVFEVDSILITSKALIVIEIKSIKGGIEGSATDHKWMKVLGNVKHEITNPVTQNDKHIEHITRMMDERMPTISLIVFSNRAQYINVSGTPSHVVITRHADLFDILDEIDRSLPFVMNEVQIKHMYKNILSHKATKREDIKLHKNITTKGHGK